jgi:hypothetical protein
MNYQLSLLLLITAVFYNIVVFAQDQDAKDPLTDFCRRFGHATAEVDRKLFINGGQFTSNPISDSKHNRTSNFNLISIKEISKKVADGF